MKSLIEQLKNGCAYHEKRWSGDTHDDIGGTIDETQTDAIMLDAALVIESFLQIVEAVEFIKRKCIETELP